jgi:hypothetical protein
MDVFATIGVLSSIVQLIAFGGDLLSKGTQLYRSANGALEENEAAEIAARQVLRLKDELEQSVVSIQDKDLLELCGVVTKAGDKFLQALERLKVRGNPGKLKSMRKALQSVWGKDELQSLEHQLSTFKDNLRLHIEVNIRYS